MGLGDMVNKAKDKLQSPEFEEKTDAALNKAADFVSEKTGHKYDDKIKRARDFADEHLGGGETDADGTDPSPATGH